MDSDEVDFTEDKLKEGLTELELGIYNKNISAIHEARYDNLFYKLRCFVIHEYRLPTPNALNLDENSLVPIYYCFNNQYRLWFSPKIISLILDECIEKIKVLNIHSYEDVFEFVPKCWI